MSRRILIVLTLVTTAMVFASGVAVAQGVAVYHSPNDDGIDPGPIVLTPTGTTTLHLYLNAGPTPSGGPGPCCNGQGDEVFGWNLKLGATGGITIASFLPVVAGVAHQTPVRLQLNGGDFSSGDLGPTKLADIVVQSTGSGALSLLGGEVVGPSLELRSVGPRMIVSAPEPSFGSMIVCGLIGLVALVRRAQPEVERPMRRVMAAGMLLSLVMSSVSARAAITCGDLDGDGDVDSFDAEILRADLAGVAPMSVAQDVACNVIFETRAPGLEPWPGDLAGECSMSDVVVMQRSGDGNLPGVTQVCAIGSSADCCLAHPGEGCNSPGTVACVCEQNPSCCTTGWSESCATLACTTSCEPRCTVNPITAENCKSSADGVVDRSVWDVPGYQLASAANHYLLPIPSIEGFATEFSVAPGESVIFKVDNRTNGGPALPYSAEIFRLGWYEGFGARRVAQFPVVAQPQQPACSTLCISSTVPCPLTESYRDCSNWSVSAQWAIPSNAVSGVYLAKFTKPSGDSGHVIFVVREAPGSPPADILYQLEDHTWQAYNEGASDYGHSLYYNSAPYTSNDHTRAASYNRPFRNRYAEGPSSHFFFEIDVAMIAFLERNGFSVGYAGSADLDASSQLLSGRKAYLASGHDEYWTGARRNAVEAAAEAGTHLLLVGTQHAYAKTRWLEAAGVPARRVLVGYKYASAAIDPLRNQDEWSGMWRDTRSGQAWVRPASQPARPESALSGVATAAAANDGANLTVPSTMQAQRFWRGTCVGLPGCFLGDRNVGFEYDIRVDRYYEVHTSQQPAGLSSLSATLMTRPLDDSSNAQLLWGVKAQQDVADFTLPRLTAEATLHRKSSGALVFASSTMRWPWGLDTARNDGSSGVSSRAVQQATINLLADMGI